MYKFAMTLFMDGRDNGYVIFFGGGGECEGLALSVVDGR